ncbi:hypothetical protein RUM43_013747 [Polyplax serrata]|uniref:PAS fold-3 domain-containing protein n=1 Tax=Polyplax serrata TaxID=468196 RepID=A0AAN8PGV3_POLSC
MENIRVIGKVEGVMHQKIQLYADRTLERRHDAMSPWALSDIVHQSVYELVHSEDREELQRQLLWNSFVPPDSGSLGLGEVLSPEHYHLLERSFTVRFRCLLDNTSGFLRLDIRGRIKILHGQNRKTEEPPLALFAICTPFGPPSLLEVPQKEVMFKSKHKLDLALVSMDQRGKMLLGYSDAELANMGGYDLVHYDDLAYVASAHQELLKTGASGMIAYRFQTQNGQWQWLQTSSRLVYKNSKPDFVISTHRPLMEEEGRDLLGKRTMDFKVSYLDAGLSNSYFADSDQLIGSNGGTLTPTPQRVNRRYKTQLRDFLSTCRTKRKIQPQATPSVVTTSPATTVEYIPAPETVYSNLNPVYSTGYSETGYMGHPVSSNFQHSLYPVDNRFLSTGDIFHQYATRSYYPDYSTPYNGFLPTYETPVLAKDPCPTLEQTKYATVVDSRGYVVSNPKCLDSTGYVMTGDISLGKHYAAAVAPSKQSPAPNSAGSSPTAATNGIITPKVEEMKTDTAGHLHYSSTAAQERQTVLMWGSTGSSNRSTPNKSISNGTPYTMESTVQGGTDPLKSLAEMNSTGDGTCKWQTGIGKAEPVSPVRATSPKRFQDPAAGEVYHQHHQYQYHQYYPYTPYHHHATQ